MPPPLFLQCLALATIPALRQRRKVQFATKSYMKVKNNLIITINTFDSYQEITAIFTPSLPKLVSSPISLPYLVIHSPRMLSDWWQPALFSCPRILDTVFTMASLALIAGLGWRYSDVLFRTSTIALLVISAFWWQRWRERNWIKSDYNSGDLKLREQKNVSNHLQTHFFKCMNVCLYVWLLSQVPWSLHLVWFPLLLQLSHLPSVNIIITEMKLTETSIFRCLT